MKPLFKNTTIYNSKIYNEFMKFHDDKFGFSYNAYNIIMICLLLYCVIFSLINKEFMVFVLFLAMLIFLILFRIYIPLKRHQNEEKKYSKNKQSKVSFSFYNYYFKIGKKFVYYYKLYKIFETKDYFYLYLDEQNAFLVSKTGFTVGTSEDFGDFIKKKCLLKFKKHKQKKQKEEKTVE